MTGDKNTTTERVDPSAVCAGFKIKPKDESWWQDMDRDAAEYLASLDDE